MDTSSGIRVTDMGKIPALLLALSQSVPAEFRHSRHLPILDISESSLLCTRTSGPSLRLARESSQLPYHVPPLSSEGSDSKPEEVASQYASQAPYGAQYQQGLECTRRWPHHHPWTPPPGSMPPPPQWPYWDAWAAYCQHSPRALSLTQEVLRDTPSACRTQSFGASRKYH